MKKLLLAAVIFSFGMSFTSCKKCTTCTIKNPDGTVLQAYPEVCGKDEVDAIKAQTSAAAALIGGTAECTD